MNPAPNQPEIMRFFEYDHLPQRLQVISAPFGELANLLCGFLPDNTERKVALRKLLEAKDCAVRANIMPPPSTPKPENTPPRIPQLDD